MLIYNTTYQTGIDDARNFVIWLSESYIPEVEKRREYYKIPVLRTSLVTKSRIQNVFSCNGRWKIQRPCIVGILSKDASE